MTGWLTAAFLLLAAPALAQTAIRPDQICPGGTCGTPDITWGLGGGGYVIGSTVPWRTNSTGPTIAATDFTANDLGRIVELSYPTGPITATIPTATGSTWGDGAGFTIQTKSQGLTLNVTSGLINGLASIKLGPYQSAGLASRGGNWYATLSIPQPASVTGKVLSDNMTWITSGVAPTVCAEATSWFGRAGTLDTPHHDAYQAMICGLVDDGVWSTLDVLYVFATQTQTAAQLNLVSGSYPVTEHPGGGSPVWTADAGYTGGAASNTTVYLDTAYNPGTAALKFALNSATMVVWSFTATSNAGLPIGSYDNTQTSGVIPRYTDNTFYGQLNVTTGSASAVLSDGSGSSIVTRNGSALEIYRNGTSVNTTTVASSAVPNGNIYILNRNHAGTVEGGSPYQIPAAALGSGWTDAQAAAFHNRVCTFLQTVHTTC